MRSRRAEQGLINLADNVDTLITIPNQKLLSLGDADLSFMDAFRKADEVLFQAVQGISDLITKAGVINVDFADVRRIMEDHRGRALMGTSCAKGEGRARLAAEQAVRSPLLDDISVDGATGVLLNIVGGPDMSMREIEEAASYVHEMAHEDADIIFGAAVDEDMTEMMKVTVIATGFDRAEEEHGELMRAASRQPYESQAPMSARGARPVARTMPLRTAAAEPRMSSSHSPESAPASVHSSRSGQHALGSSNGVTIRETISFPKSSDADWDVPAFQRRGL